jgi:hypothetical protein
MSWINCLCDSPLLWLHAYFLLWSKKNTFATSICFLLLNGLEKLKCVLSLLGSVIIGSLQQVAQREGFRGLYCGLSPTILALLPNWAVSTSISATLFHIRYR